MGSWRVPKNHPDLVLDTSTWFKDGQRFRLMDIDGKPLAYAKVFPRASTQDVSVCESLMAAVINGKRVQIRVADRELLVGVDGVDITMWQGAGEIPEEALCHVGVCFVSRFGIDLTSVGEHVNRNDVMGAADDMMMDLMSDEEVDRFTDVMVNMMSSWTYVISVELQGIE